MTRGVRSGRLMPMNQAREAYGSFPYNLSARKIVSVMTLGLVSTRIRNRATIRAGLALVFALQIVGLCFCMPAAVDEHDCCPPNETDFPGGLSVDLSAPTSTDCCPDGPGMRAILRISEPDVTASPNIHATVVHAWLVRTNAPAQPHYTGSVPVGRVSPARRSPILRI